MRIRHLPCGLFPHFDSGMERRPLYPEAGQTVRIGCRLDDATRQVEALLYWKQKPDVTWNVVSAELMAEGQDERYRGFVLFCPSSFAEVEYYIEVQSPEGMAKSEQFSFSPLRRLQLEAPHIVWGEKETRLEYRAGHSSLRLAITRTGNVSCYIDLNVFGQNVELTKGGDTTGGVCEAFVPLKLEENSAALAMLSPEVQLWADSEGKAYELEWCFCVPGTAVYGLGEKFDSVNQQGRSPLNAVVEQYTNQLEKSYLPIPFFFTEQGIGYLQEGNWRSRFYFTDGPKCGWTTVRIHARCPREGKLFFGRFFGGSPAEQLRQYADATGNPALPPKWTFGPWMSSNGWNTQTEALEQVTRMNELAIPATVEVLEAWSDEETFYIWNDAQYTPKSDGEPFAYSDFTFPPGGKWPNPKDFVKNLEKNGMKLILWQIPVVKYEKAPHGPQLDLDEEYAVANRLCIGYSDGSPYRITEMWFSNSLLPDFTNPETIKWWFDKRSYLLEMGVAGFKTDGGEFLFDDTALLFDGRTAEETHNDYPNQYVGAYHHFMDSVLGAGQGATFSRAGYTGAQKYPIHWAGDQVSDWSELRSQLTAGLSLGLSGVPFWGFDIGGFAGDFPSTELYLRSAAFGAFAPVMQFHSEPRNGQYFMTERERWNNDRSPWNMAEANRDNKIISVYRLFANLRMNLLPYLWQEAGYSAETARPLMAHLVYDYPNDPTVLNLDDEYMLGRSLLVAPIVTEGADGREVYLPAGAWYDFWTGERTEKRQIFVPCGLERIPVFVREGSVLPLNLNYNFRMGGMGRETVISNRIDCYESLCLFLYGSGENKFADELGTTLTLNAFDGRLDLSGNCNLPLSVFPADGKSLREVLVNGTAIPIVPKEAKCFDRKIPGILIQPVFF